MTFDKANPLELVISEQGRKESRRANAAFRDYVRMGVNKSLRDLLDKYKANPDEAPTTQWATISLWSADYYWVKRKEAYDDNQLAADQAAYEARRREIMESGLALVHERIFKLTALFSQLEEYLKDEDLVWLKETKQVIEGADDEDKAAKIIEIVKMRFNSPLFEQFRLTLDDISKEMGQRVKKTELSGPDGDPITVATPQQMDEIRQKRWQGAQIALAGAEAGDESVIDEAANE